MDPGNSSENLKGPAEVTPPPDTPANSGVTGAVGRAGEVPDESADDAQTSGKPSVKSLAIRGSAFVICGNLSQQFIRLASNLLLTRLLLPEDFGLMLVVNVVLFGLQMFSDIGIGPSIIQHKRGNEPAFYNTAWTVQIIRGFVLALAGVLLVAPAIYLIGGTIDTLGWVDSDGNPLVYTDPLLIPLICVGSLTALISGFNSTKLYTINRKMAMGRLTTLEVVVQTTGVVAMACWAWYFHSVWALIGGGLTQSWLKMLLSHVLLPGEKNRLHFERAAFNDLLQFGKWIFLSTSALFIAAHGDRVIMGFYLDKAVLGVYGMAYFLSEALAQMIEFVSRLVFLPAFSKVARDNPDRLRLNYYKVRLRLDALTLPAAGGLMMLGQDVVDLLYPDEFVDAGWMLQILAIRVALACTLPAAVSCLLAIGDSKSVFAGNLGKTVVLLTGIPLGWYLGELPGIIWAIALSELGSLPILWWRMARHGLLRPSREALALVFVAVGMGTGWLVHLAWVWLWS